MGARPCAPWPVSVNAASGQRKAGQRQIDLQSWGQGPLITDLECRTTLGSYLGITSVSLEKEKFLPQVAKSELLVVKEKNKGLIRLKTQQSVCLQEVVFRWSVAEDVICGIGLVVN